MFITIHTCTSIQHALGSLELTGLTINVSASEGNAGQTIGIVDVMSSGIDAPPSLTTNCDGVVSLRPRRNGTLLTSLVLVPITSCLASTEHCT